MTQERARRTRDAVLRAAAERIDRDGYQGTSLVGVCQDAGISLGALTFHFSTKARLAEALEERGTAAMRVTADRARALPVSPLRRARALVLAVARLLQEDPEARAAARLFRERHRAEALWSAAWLTSLRTLLEQAADEGQLHPDVKPETVTTTAAYLIAGVDSHLRMRAHAPDREAPEQPEVLEQLVQVWDLMLYGAAATGRSQARPTGPCRADR